MNYKKYIAAVMALSMATGVAGCGSSSNSSSKAEDDFSATENVAVADTESIEAIPEGAEKEILYLGEGDINPHARWKALCCASWLFCFCYALL